MCSSVSCEAQNAPRVSKRSQIRSVLATSLALIMISVAARAEDEPGDWAEARRSVERAETLFGAGNFEAALVDYASAYQLLAGHPRRYVVLHNLAVCYERMFRYDEALRNYERYLVEGGPTAEDAAAVTTALDALRGMLATVRVESNVRGEVWVDLRRAGDVPATLTIPAGRHLIEVRATLYETERRELTLSARSNHRIQFELTPLSNYRGLGRGYFFTGAALTGALLVTSGILAANTLSAHRRAVDRAAQSMQLRTELVEREQARVRHWALATDLTLGAAALCGAATLVAYVLTDWGDEEHASAPPSMSLAATPSGVTLRAYLP